MFLDAFGLLLPHKLHEFAFSISIGVIVIDGSTKILPYVIFPTVPLPPNILYVIVALSVEAFRPLEIFL